MDQIAPKQDQAPEPELETALRKEQKLEMMGALAGFIAHDLNNELTVILGNVGLSLDSLEPSHSLYEGLHEAQQATQRCVAMTRAAEPGPEREAGVAARPAGPAAERYRADSA
jgi:signal transduction histidine kinase